MPSQELDQLAINTIRTLSIDAVQKANSGHPGLPLGAAPMAYVLWMRFMRHNPRNPKWPDRDRFAFSAGHGSMLLYSLLYLTGYDLSLDEIKHFRQWGSKTPGHPEYRLTPGVDLTALERALQAGIDETGRPSLIIVRTILGYGSPHKAGSFQAHGSPLGADEVAATKRNLGWPTTDTFWVPDEALQQFRQAVERGAGYEQEWQQRFEAYAKEFPDLAAQFRRTMSGDLPQGWDRGLPMFKPEDAKDGKLATRAAGGTVINAIATSLPELMGGSADLNPSADAALKGAGDFESPANLAKDRQGSVGTAWGYAGRNMFYGVREHAMGSITNGIVYHGGLRAFSATFLVFSDYMRPPLRLAALSELPSIFVYTHDSIGLGEDGPTHQPIEHLAALRAIPNMVVFRPADANEVTEGWRVAIERRDGPTILVFSRQALPILDRQRVAPASGARRGAYVLVDPPEGEPELILIATGSEVSL